MDKIEIDLRNTIWREVHEVLTEQVNSKVITHSTFNTIQSKIYKRIFGG